MCKFSFLVYLKNSFLHREVSCLIQVLLRSYSTLHNHNDHSLCVLLFTAKSSYLQSNRQMPFLVFREKSTPNSKRNAFAEKEILKIVLKRIRKSSQSERAALERSKQKIDCVCLEQEACLWSWKSWWFDDSKERAAGKCRVGNHKKNNISRIIQASSM